MGIQEKVPHQEVWGSRSKWIKLHEPKAVNDSRLLIMGARFLPLLGHLLWEMKIKVGPLRIDSSIVSFYRQLKYVEIDITFRRGLDTWSS